MKKFHQMAIVFLLIVQFSTIIYPQSLTSKIDSLLEVKYQPDMPGAVFLVSKKGIVIYRKAFGQANIELNVPMNPENVFQIGSMTKQFTAIAILMLLEQGKLKLDDEITKFIPNYPTNGNKITIHHLLTHTSGIKSFTRMKSIRNIAKEELTPVELIDFFKDEPMDFNPGEQFKYNNSGYVILGYIIELLSGKTFSEYIEQNIFQRLEMHSSRFASHSNIIKNRASGYHYKKGYINNTYISFSIPFAAGSLMSTVDDMFKWQKAITNNILISDSTKKKAFTNYCLNNGENINYGYGWHLKRINGVQSIEHGGDIFGFKSMGVYVPVKDIYIIGLSNCDCNSPTEVTRKIALLTMDKDK
jgi:CubicO group peptidase (beta-lactamase class C family)